MRAEIERLKDKHSGIIVSPCITCLSVASVPNTLPLLEAHCRKLASFSCIVVLSTKLSSRVRLHERLLDRRVTYVTLDDVIVEIEESRSLNEVNLECLRRHGHRFEMAECVFLASSHWALIGVPLRSAICELGFGGVFVDSVEVFCDVIAQS